MSALAWEGQTLSLSYRALPCTVSRNKFKAPEQKKTKKTANCQSLIASTGHSASRCRDPEYRTTEVTGVTKGQDDGA